MIFEVVDFTVKRVKTEDFYSKTCICQKKAV